MVGRYGKLVGPIPCKAADGVPTVLVLAVKSKTLHGNRQPAFIDIAVAVNQELAEEALDEWIKKFGDLYLGEYELKRVPFKL